MRGLVTVLERSVIDLLAAHGIAGRARPDAPGVYVEDAKVALLGLRLRQGFLPRPESQRGHGLGTLHPDQSLAVILACK